MSVTFRERMAGPVHVVDRVPWRVPPRGARAGDGLVRLVADAVGRSTERIGGVLDLDRLTVTVPGSSTEPERDGYAAEVTTGIVLGVRRRPLDVVAGFADLLTRTPTGRRMHYRLLVVDGPHRYVVEGVKTVEGGLRTAWRETTTLHTVVVRLTGPQAVPTTGTARWLAAGDLDGEVVLAGVLRVRGLLAQGASMRGRLLPFLAGFIRRTARPRASLR